MIKVLFFARLREQLGCTELELAAADVADLTGLRSRLLELHPSWCEFLQSEKILTAHNQTLVKGNVVVNDGDEVAFFPPVTGG